MFEAISLVITFHLQNSRPQIRKTNKASKFRTSSMVVTTPLTAERFPLNSHEIMWLKISWKISFIDSIYSSPNDTY